MQFRKRQERESKTRALYKEEITSYSLLLLEVQLQRLELNLLE